jgi:hypothetical protein
MSLSRLRLSIEHLVGAAVSTYSSTPRTACAGGDGDAAAELEGGGVGAADVHDKVDEGSGTTVKST